MPDLCRTSVLCYISTNCPVLTRCQFAIETSVLCALRSKS